MELSKRFPFSYPLTVAILPSVIGVDLHKPSSILHAAYNDEEDVTDRLAFSKGETIHTENSYKYTRDGFEELVNQASFEITSSWLDDEYLFSVHYLSVVCD